MAEGDNSLPSPGWYRDPTVEGHQRYWDGSKWTDDRMALDAGGEGRATPHSGVGEVAATRGRNTFDAPLIFVLVGLLMIGGCGALLVGLPLVVRDSGPEPRPAIPQTTAVEGFAVTTTGPPLPTDGPGTETTTAPAGGIVTGFGSAMTTPANVGAGGEPSIWEIRVDQPVDVTADVLAANPLDPEPLEHIRHVAIPLTLTLHQSGPDAVPLKNLGDGLSIVFEGGATGGGYVPDQADGSENPFGCSAVVEPFPSSGELSTGESVSASFCIQVPTADIDHSNSRILVWVAGGPPLVWVP